MFILISKSSSRQNNRLTSLFNHGQSIAMKMKAANVAVNKRDSKILCVNLLLNSICIEVCKALNLRWLFNADTPDQQVNIVPGTYSTTTRY